MKLDRRLLDLARSEAFALSLSIGLGALNGALLVAQAWAISQAIARVFLRGETLADVTPLLLGAAGLLAGRALVSWGADVAAALAAERIKHALRSRMVAHLAALGPAILAGERAGELSTTLTEGIESLDATFRQYIPRLALAAIVPVMILAFVFPIDLLTGVVLLVTAPLIPVFMALIGSLAGEVSRRRWGTLSRLSAHFLDVLQGLPTLRMFGLSRGQTASIDLASERFRQATMEVLRVAFLSAFALEMIGTISTAVVAVQVGLRLLYGYIGFEQALFGLILAPEFYQPMRALGMSFHAATSGAAAAERIFAILAIPARQTSGAVRVIPDASGGVRIRIDRVSCAYHDAQGQRQALRDVSFEIAPGEVVALAGPTGAGKSTIASLLLRFIDPEDGVIYANDLPLVALDLPTWRRQIAWMPQTPYLIPTTIADNIRLGRPEVTPDEVAHAARLAHADEFIARLPGGYGAIVGERGIRLSGGQAQRVALARAFLVDAPLVILDEATTHLDAATRGLVRESIRALVRGRSALIIAHDLDTIAGADRVVVLDSGRVAEVGTPAALRASSGLYARLLDEQEGLVA